MNRSVAVVVAGVLAFLSPVSAEETDSHRLAAIKMIRAYEVKSFEDRGRDVAETLIRAGVVPADSIDRLAEKMARLLGWDQFVDLTAEVYAKHFPEEELLRITESLGDPTMQKFLAIRFQIMQDSMSRVAELFDEFGITEEFSD